MPRLAPEEDEAQACTPAEKLLNLDILEPENIGNTLHACQPAKRCKVVNVAELLMGVKGAFITSADFLIDGGATAGCFYGPLKP